jgi:isoquinoline 1-oxidoreductase beta subunit
MKLFHDEDIVWRAYASPERRRLALLDNSPRAKAILALAAQKAGWGDKLPDRVGRGVSLQFACATFMAHVAEVEVAKPQQE